MSIVLEKVLTPGGITQDELDDLRVEQLKFMPEEGTLRRKIYDEHDFITRTLTEDMRHRLTSGPGMFNTVAERLQCINPYVLTVTWDQDIQATDQLVDQEGRIFEVRTVRAPKTYQTAKQCLVELVT
jgi:hypothetical protein